MTSVNSAFFNAPLKVPTGTSLEVNGTTFLNDTTNVTSTLNIVNGANLALYSSAGFTTKLRSGATALSYTLTLPPNVGSPNQVLTTDGASGSLTWSTVSGGSSNIASNAVTVSNEGNITFATNSGSANVRVDASNVIALIVGTTNTSISASTVTINQSTASSNTTTGALVVGGGVGVAGAVNVGDALTVTGNSVFNSRFVQAVDKIVEDPSNITDAANIWTSGYKSIKYLRPQSNSTSYYLATGGSLVDGQMLHVFFAPAVTNTSRLDFGAARLYTGAGSAQYLTFTTTGQSATLIYLADTPGAGWRVINTGAQVSS